MCVKSALPNMFVTNKFEVTEERTNFKNQLSITYVLNSTTITIYYFSVITN